MRRAQCVPEVKEPSDGWLNLRTSEESMGDGFLCMSRMTSSRGAVRGRALLMADMGQESVAADLAVKDAPSCDDKR